MTHKELIRRRVHQKLSLKEYKAFTLFAKIIKITENSILVTKVKTNSKFWVDISRFKAEDETFISKHFKEGDEVELKVSFNCCINKNNEHAVRLHLADIDSADSKETYGFEFREQEFDFDGRLIECLKTDLPNIYLLKIARFDFTKKEQEIYHIRYYNEDRAPALDEYEVCFYLKNTPNIIDANGEVYTHEEKYQIEVDGKLEERTNKIFVPCLEIRGLYLKV